MLTSMPVEKDDVLSFDIPILEGIPPEKACSVLHCLNASIVRCKRGDVIARNEEKRHFAGYLLQGSALGVRYDYWGNRSIISEYPSGSVIAGEVLFGIGAGAGAVIPLTIIASDDCAMINFNIDQKVQGCPHCMRYANIVRDNVTLLLFETNNRLTQRLKTLSNRSTREKLLSYFTEQAECVGSNCFSIPFNRQELADYLYIERTALSRELSNMQKDGLIAYNKNEFTLLKAGGKDLA